MIFESLHVHICKSPDPHLLSIKVTQVTTDGPVTGANIARATNVLEAQERAIAALRGKTKRIYFTCALPLRFNSNYDSAPCFERTYEYPESTWVGKL